MKKILLSSLFVALSFYAWAQERTVTGKVTDVQDGLALPGVNVTVKGTTSGTVTDSEGKYSLLVPGSESVLVFTFIGLTSQEITVGNRTTIDIGMQQDLTQLTEVVVVETGYTQERKFVGSAVVLGKDMIERAPMASLDQSLQGRAAGVLVNSGSGQPGANATVRIRGVSSITGANTQPLYVIDGVPVLGALAGINSNDIESQTILKDGSTGALYGARGANGVIVINTKKGEPGKNTFSYRTQVGVSIQPPPQNFEMMTTAQTLQFEEDLGLAGFGVTGPGWNYSPKNPNYAGLTEQKKAEYDALLAGFKDNNLDYADLLFRNGVSTTHELMARGGSEASRYYTSFNVFDQDGFAKGSNFTRYTGRLNLDHRMDKLTLTLMSTIVHSQTTSSIGDWLGNSPGNPFQIVWRAKPYEAVFKDDGSLDFGANAANTPRRIANTLERQQNTTYRQRDLRILGALGLKYDILEGLSIRNNLGIDMGNLQGMYAIRPDSYAGSGETYNAGYLTEGMLNQSQIVNTTSLNYSHLFSNKHEVEVGAYFEAIKVSSNGFGYFMRNLDKRLYQTGQNASDIPVSPGQETFPQNSSNARSVYGIRSYFATSRYTYLDKYTANFNVRRDGTSRIANDKNKEILTWSAGLGWDATNEEFIKSQNIVTELKVRVTYGSVPNIGSIAVANYGIGSAFFNVPNYLGPQIPTFESSPDFAGSKISGIIPDTPGNPDLKIETVQMFNAGFDVAIMNKARLVVDLYKNTTVDLFVSKPLWSTTGYGGTSLPINAGTMSNKGIELTLLGDIYKKGNWTVEANWNHAINVNKIEDLGPVDEYQVGTFLIKEGLPYGSHYTYDYVGADPATGRPVYRKEDGTTTTSSADAGQVAKFGTYLPKHIGGISLIGKYKRIKVSTLFTYQYDVVRSNNVWNWVTRGVPGYINAVNQSTVLLTEQWRKPGDQKFYQSPGYDRGFTSSDLMDAKFFRFREIMISYTISKLAFLDNVRVYGRAQNLKIWSPWRGLDPEDDNNISLNEYPNPRMFIFGLDISF